MPKKATLKGNFNNRAKAGINGLMHKSDSLFDCSIGGTTIMMNRSLEKMLYTLDNIMFEVGDQVTKESTAEIAQIINSIEPNHFCELCLQAVKIGKPNLLVSLLLAHQEVLDREPLSNEFMMKLIEEAANHANIGLLEYLKIKNGSLVKACSLACELLEHPDKEMIEKTVTKLVVYKRKTPRFNTELTKLLIAAKNDKSTAELNIIVTDDMSFNSFLSELAKLALISNATLRLQFIHADTVRNHWLAGEVDIKNEEIQFLIVDSLGGEEVTSKYELTCNEAVKKIHAHFPKAKIYCNTERLQHNDHESCTLFAIDTAMHLRSADKYLPGEFTDKTLFEYLNTHRLGLHQYENGTEIIITKLPLRFIRSMQSLTALNTESDSKFFTHSGLYQRLNKEKVSEKELTQPINKRNEMMEQSVKKYVAVDNDKEVNRRIQHKVDTFREALIKFMLKHDKKFIATAKDNYEQNSVLSRILSAIEQQNNKPAK